MEFTARTVQPDQIRAGCVVVPVLDSRRLGPSAEQVDGAADGSLTKALRDGDLGSDVGSTLLLRDLNAGGSGVRATRVLVVRCGAAGEMDDARYRKALKGAAQALLRTGARDAVVCLTEVAVPERDARWQTREIVEALRAAAYRFDALKSERNANAPQLRRVTVGVRGRRELRLAEQAIPEAVAIADGKDLARELGNLPGNHCTPSYLADRARQLARGRRGLTVRVLDEAQMRRLGMEALLSVARGSRQPAKLICLEYAGGRKDRRPVVLVGKGVTFDSGGISIKPAAAMDEMKFDMCGAASVLGTLQAASDLRLDINVVGLIPATENLPDGQANKPGDIVKSMSGQTIEILNTDAEGRLILCDALTYAARFEPDTVIDIATLTGACVVALGNHPSGLFSNHRGLADDLAACGSFTGDRVWELPLWADYQEQLKSNFADVANVGGRAGGAITAACFLERFARDYRWAHLDIAGTAWLSADAKGATGRPVALLTQYLIDRARPSSQRRKRAA